MKKKQAKTVYDEIYAARMVKWFKNAPLYLTEVKEVYNKKTDCNEKICTKVAAPCPSFVRFADEQGLAVDVFKKWCEKYPEFAEAYEKAKMFQEEWLMNAAGLGFYNSSMSIMALKANHGWVEKQDARNSRNNADLKQVLVRFVKDNELKQSEKEEESEKSDGQDTGDFCAADDQKIPD